MSDSPCLNISWPQRNDMICFKIFGLQGAEQNREIKNHRNCLAKSLLAKTCYAQRKWFIYLFIFNASSASHRRLNLIFLRMWRQLLASVHIVLASFKVMQVTAGMHNIRAFKAEKQQNSNMNTRRVGGSRSTCTNWHTTSSILKKRVGPRRKGCWESGRVRGMQTDKGFLSVKRNTVSFSVCVYVCKRERKRERGTDRKQRGGAGAEERSELL